MDSEKISVLERLPDGLSFNTGLLREGKEKSPPSWLASHPKTRRALWVALDLFASAIWIYVFLRVFVGDFERWMLGKVAPEWVWLLDYRFFGFLLLLAIAAIVIRKKFAWVPIYVLLFPFIVVIWKVPRLLYKRGSWTIALGVIHVVVSSFKGARFTIISGTVVAFAALFILTTDVELLVVISAGAVLVLWLALLYKAFRYAITPARFVRSQRRLFDFLLSGDVFWRLVNVEDPYKTGDFKQLDQARATAVVQRVGMGLVAYRGSQLWALRLDEYRRSGASIVFSAASIIGLLAQGLVTFTLVNQAIFKVDPSQFEFEREPGLVTLAYYSFSSLFVSEISQVSPAGAWSSGVNIMAGFSTAVFIMILVSTVFFGFRESRSNAAADTEIAALKVNADRFAEKLGREYDMSVDRLFGKMEELGWDILGMLAYFAKNVPSEDPPQADPGDAQAGEARP